MAFPAGYSTLVPERKSYMDPAHGSMGLKYLSNAIANAPSKSRIRPRGKGVAKGGILGQHNACGHAHNKRLQLLDGDRSVDYIGRYFLTSLSFGASYDDIYRSSRFLSVPPYTPPATVMVSQSLNVLKRKGQVG